jgi:Protein of unknown function (DUF742)
MFDDPDSSDGKADEPPPSATRPYLAVGPASGPSPDESPDESVDESFHDDPVTGLRPYLLTSGRAEPVDRTLEIEAQVLTTGLGVDRYRVLAFEQRDIVRLCTSTRSVAEVAALLGLHIGVARVLVADLAAVGYLVVQRPSLPLAQDPHLIERVIRGLEAIR